MAVKKATKKATAPAKATKAKAAAPAAKKATAPAKKATAPKQAAAPAVETVGAALIGVDAVSYRAFLTDLSALVAKHLSALDGGTGVAVAAPVDEKAAYQAKLEGLSLPGLRQEAIKRGFDKDEVKQVTDRAVIINGLMDDRFPADADDDAVADDEDDESEEIEDEADDEESDEDDEDESDEDEDEEDDEDEDSDEEDEDESDEEDEDEEEGDEEDEEEGEDEEYSRDELLAMPIKKLRDLVKETAEMNDEKPPKGYAKWDADTCADYIIGEEEGDEDEESEEEAYTEADYRKMPLAQLKTLATENSVKLPRGLDKKSAKEQKAAVIKALLA